MNTLLRLALCVLSAMVLSVSCGDDEEILAAYRQDLVEVVTDGTGAAAELLLDDGTRLSFARRRQGYVPDTVYRMRALYTLQDGTADVSALVPVLSPLPHAYAPQAVRTDPVGVSALWRGGRYVNFRLDIKTAGGAHYFGFIDRGCRQNAAGGLTQQVELLHNQNADPLHYTREVWLSCPLFGFAESLRPGEDSVEVTVRTFSEQTRRSFLY